MVPTTKEILFSRTFPGYFQDKHFHFPGQIIQYLKVINQDMCKKHIIYIQCMINY